MQFVPSRDSFVAQFTLPNVCRTMWKHITSPNLYQMQLCKSQVACIVQNQKSSKFQAQASQIPRKIRSKNRLLHATIDQLSIFALMRSSNIAATFWFTLVYLPTCHLIKILISINPKNLPANITFLHHFIPLLSIKFIGHYPTFFLLNYYQYQIKILICTYYNW